MLITVSYFVGLVIGFICGAGYIQNKVLYNVTDVMLKLIDHLIELPEGPYTTGAAAYIAKIQVALHDIYPNNVDISYARQVANDNP